MVRKVSEYSAFDLAERWTRNKEPEFVRLLALMLADAALLKASNHCPPGGRDRRQLRLMQKQIDKMKRRRPR